MSVMVGSEVKGLQQKTKYTALFALFVQCVFVVFGAIMVAMAHGNRDSKKHKIEKLIWGTAQSTEDLKKNDVWGLIEELQQLKISEIFWTWFTLISGVTLADYVLLICAAACRSLTLCNTWCVVTPGIICLLDLAPLIYIFSADDTAKLTFLVVTLIGYVFRIIMYIIVTYFIRELIQNRESPPVVPEESQVDVSTGPATSISRLKCIKE